jgi:hypothetical protein
MFVSFFVHLRWCWHVLRRQFERFCGWWCLTDMSRASHYRAQADLGRRLAEITVQPNLERELRPVSKDWTISQTKSRTIPIPSAQRCWRRVISCALIGVGALLQKVPLGTEFGR